MKPYSFLLIIFFILVAFKTDAAPGDTLYHQDFNGQLPSGWQSQSNSSHNHLWIWSNTAPGGQYVLNSNPLNSPTANNGFLVLPSDLYNTPTPAGGFVNVNASITSDAISINPSNSVHLSFYQSQRFCCTQSNAMYVEVSADSVNWTVFPATNYRTSEASSENGEYLKINVTSVLAGQSTAYLRFVQSGASHYYWMIDDVMLIEGPKNQLEISKMRMMAIDTLSFDLNYYALDYTKQCAPILKFNLENTGSHVVNNPKCFIEFYFDSSYNANYGYKFSRDSLLISNSLVPTHESIVEFQLPRSITAGYYKIILNCESDSVFDREAKDTIQFEFGGFTLSNAERDFYPSTTLNLNAIQGSGNFGTPFSSSPKGDFVGALFEGFDERCSDLSVYISSDSINVGTVVIPLIYHYDASNAILDSALTLLSYSLVPYTIQASDLDDWLNLDFNLGTGPLHLMTGELYACGIGLVNNNNQSSISLGRASIVENRSLVPVGVTYLGGSIDDWSLSSMSPAIRASNSQSVGWYGGCSTYTALKEQNNSSELKVYPNPSTGQLFISHNELIGNQVSIVVKDLQGKLVYQSNLFKQKSNQVELNLSHLINGMYIIQVNSGFNSFQEKVLIQH